MLANIQFRIFYLPVSCIRDVKFKTYETVILPVVLYGCETLFLILSEGHILRVFGKRCCGEYTQQVTGH
jgi:hypothetical protein